MGVRQSHGIFVLCFVNLAAGFSNVQCTAPVCPKDRRAVRKLDGPKIWAFGCDVPSPGNGTLHRCCIEKEICMRTCGMPWKKCGRQFEKCSEKACDMDEDCIAVAEEADLLITGGASHFTVCKGYRDALQELCDCVAPEAASATADARLTDFYTKYAPQRLVDGKVKDVEEVWKKWHNREAELFYELARKYKTEAVEMRLHSEADLNRLRDVNKRESQQAEEKLEPEASETDLQEERLRERFAEEEALAEKELAQRRAQIAELENAKASAQWQLKTFYEPKK